MISRLLYRWIDRRGRIPRWVRWLYPHAHWCPEMDDLLILTEREWRCNCFCDRRHRTATEIMRRLDEWDMRQISVKRWEDES